MTESSQRSNWVAVKKGSPIKRPKDFEGKKVGLKTPGGNTEYQAMCAYDKVDRSKVQEIPVGFSSVELAQGLVDAPGMTLETAEPPTNMVYITTPVPAKQFAEMLTERNVRSNTMGPNRVRLVTHMDVDAEDIDCAIGVLWEVGKRLHASLTS